MRIKNIKNIYFFQFFLFIISICLMKYIIKKNKKGIINFEPNFEYHKYQRDIINSKIHRYSKWELTNEDPYFINGIIRK